MRSKILLAFIIWFGFLIQSCKHEIEALSEKRIETPIPCKTYDFSNCWLGASYIPTGPEYLFPRFNPNNPNEFLYVKHDTLGWPSIHKYNLQTKQHALILANVYPIVQPDWSRTGWIVFSDRGWKVWKVRDDGSGLQQLTFGENDQFPAFNPAGDKIIYRRMKEYSAYDIEHNPSLQNNKKMFVIDLNGNVLDSICAERLGYCSVWIISSWAEPDRILRQTGSKTVKEEIEFSFYNYTTKQEEPALFTSTEYKERKHFVDYKAISPTRLFYTMINKGLVDFDANSKTHRVLKSDCHDQRYGFFTISPDKNRIIIEREDNTFISECQFNQKKALYVMNLDGSNEQEIELP